MSPSTTIDELRSYLAQAYLSANMPLDVHSSDGSSLFASLPGELKSASAALLDAYEDWQPTPSGDCQSIDILCPKIFSDQTAMSHSRFDPTIDYEVIVREVVHLSLYSDTLWLPDPLEVLGHWLSEFTYPGIAQGIDFGGDLGWQRAYAALKAFDTLKPLVDAGYVAYYPHTGLYYTAVASDLFDEVRGFTEDELALAWPDGYVAEGLSFANALGISYAAVTPQEHDAIIRAVADVSAKLGVVDARVVAAAPKLTLPYFDALDPETLVAARENEAGFDTFRSTLRSVGAALSAGLEDPDFETEVKRLESELLTPEIERLRASVNTVTLLKKHLSNSGIEFCATAATCLALTAEPVSSILTGTVTAATSSIVKAIADRTGNAPVAKVAYLLSNDRTRNNALRFDR